MPDLMDQEAVQMTRDEISDIVVQKMISNSGSTLTPTQLQALKSSLQLTLSKYSVVQDQTTTDILDLQTENARVLRMFVDAKRIEGRSESTLYNYAKEISKLFLALNKSYKYISTKDLREYLSWRKDVGHLSLTTLANMRMYLMSFFKWIWREGLIERNPMDRIGVIKTEHHVIQTLSDEEQEIVRCACETERDRAIIDMLSSTAMRVSELVALNRSDIDFEKGEVIVFGKGRKERVCFLTGKCKIHLKWYLESRTDDNPALFVSNKYPYERLSKNGIESMMRRLQKKTGIKTVRLTCHCMRRSAATRLLENGAQIDKIAALLGHSNVQTTLQCYAKINKEDLRATHRKYMRN